MAICWDLSFFDTKVHGQSYLKLLNKEVIPLMTMLFQRLWWAQDEAPCHGLLAVHARLNQLFGERVLSLHNNNKWLARSPDLTP